jgi:beta-lactamase class A
MEIEMNNKHKLNFFNNRLYSYIIAIFLFCSLSAYLAACSSSTDTNLSTTTFEYTSQSITESTTIPTSSEESTTTTELVDSITDRTITQTTTTVTESTSTKETSSTDETVQVTTSETEKDDTPPINEDIIESLKTKLDITMSDDIKMTPLLNIMLSVTGNMANNMGIYYYDLTNGDVLSINGDRQFRSASTAKIFVVMAMYQAVAEGELKLDQVIYYTENDYEGGTGILQNMDLSQGYTLAELAEYAIKHSDNIAYRMIKRVTGSEKCYSFYESIIGHPTNRSQTQMSAVDAGKLLRHAYTAVDGRFNTMLDHMLYTDFENNIPKYLPAGTVSNKIGFYSTFYHDVAIIHDSSSPYILTIFSDSLTKTYDIDPSSLLADLSLEVYNGR